MTDDRLFDVEVIVPEPPLSPDRRRTRRQRQLIDAGQHPVIGLPLLGTDDTCGDCASLREVQGGNKRFFKCSLTSMTRGPGTDIRKSWPACERFDPGGEQ